MAITPELFADGECGKPLPAGELLQVFKFGQFCPVKVLDDTSEAIVVVGNKKESGNPTPTSSSSAMTAADAEAGPAPGPRIYSMNGGGLNADGRPPEFAFRQLLEGEDSLPTQPVAARVSMSREQTARAIATGKIEQEDAQWDVRFTPQALETLLDGRDVELVGVSGATAERLVLHPDEQLVRVTAKAPSGSNFAVPASDLADFLSHPTIPGEEGLPFDLKLNEKNVEELAGYGQTRVRAGTKDIDIKVVKPPIDLNAIPWRPWEPPYWERRPNGGTVRPGTGGNVSGGGNGNAATGFQPRPPLRAEDFRGVTLAVYFEWEQAWTLKGFSRGRLLHSLSLAPQEETTIELFTWDRRKRTLEQSSLTETEESVENEEKTQDTTEVYRELTKKDEFQWKVGGELDAQYNGGTINVKLKAQASAQDKTNAESVTKNTTKSIHDGVRRAAAKVKTTRSSKISETTEVGREERITRKIRNPNLCHTLNLDYYEVITHYDITTSFNEDSMRFCAMIPNPLARETFPADFVRRNEGALRDAILDRALVAGFDGLRLLRARKVASEEIKQKQERRKTEKVPSAPGPETKPATAAAVTPEESAADNYLAKLQTSCKALLAENLVEGLKNCFRSLANDNTALGTKKGSPRSDDLDQGKRWLAQQLLLRCYSQLGQKLGELAGTQSPSIRDWGPKLEPVMPTEASMPRPSQLGTESREVKEGVMVEIVRPFVAWDLFAANWAWWWGQIARVGLMEPDDAGVGATVEQFAKVYRSFLDGETRKVSDAAGKAMVQTAQAKQDQLSDEDRLESDFPIRDFAMATERSEVLLAHLAEHKNHYSFALFRGLPPQEQLDHIERAMSSIDSGFDPGYFQPRVVSQIGSWMLVPLNHEVIPNAKELLDILKERIDVEQQTDLVLLPSPGMTIDSRLGHCSACEDFIETTRSLDLDLRGAQVRQAQAEADRLDKRVGGGELDDPRPALPRIGIDLTKPAATPP